MKAFVISLTKIKESYSTAKKVLAKLKEYHFNAEIFEGVYPNESLRLFNNDNRKIAELGIKIERLTVPEYKKLYPSSYIPDNIVDVIIRTKANSDKSFQTFMYSGVIGCFYSHYRLWKKCIELDEPIFIFEDDVIFQREYHPIEWDDVLMVCTGKKAYKHDFYKPLLESPEGEYRAIDIPGSQMPGAVGYGIKPHAAKKLVETYKTEMLPADTCLNRFVVKLQCHSHLMGRATIDDDGKVSLTRMYK
jgi:glycosyl transferase family 25